jgi:hypothetical protein
MTTERNSTWLDGWWCCRGCGAESSRGPPIYGEGSATNQNQVSRATSIDPKQKQKGDEQGRGSEKSRKKQRSWRKELTSWLGHGSDLVSHTRRRRGEQTMKTRRTRFWRLAWSFIGRREWGVVVGKKNPGWLPRAPFRILKQAQQPHRFRLKAIDFGNWWLRLRSEARGVRSSASTGDSMRFSVIFDPWQRQPVEAGGDDVLGQILLRLPTMKSLPQAALSCKR